MKERPILLVEDSQDDEELAVLTLRNAGLACPIDVVRDGEEAVEYLARAAADAYVRPVLVLLDLKLPKLSGFDVLRRIRAEPSTRLVPVVVLSSSDVVADIAQAYELGANSYVRKPVEFARYSDVIGDVGKYWLELNEAL